LRGDPYPWLYILDAFSEPYRIGHAGEASWRCWICCISAHLSPAEPRPTRVLRWPVFFGRRRRPRPPKALQQPNKPPQEQRCCVHWALPSFTASLSREAAALPECGLPGFFFSCEAAARREVVVLPDKHAQSVTARLTSLGALGYNSAFDPDRISPHDPAPDPGCPQRLNWLTDLTCHNHRYIYDALMNLNSGCRKYDRLPSTSSKAMLRRPARPELPRIHPPSAWAASALSCVRARSSTKSRLLSLGIMPSSNKSMRDFLIGACCEGLATCPPAICLAVDPEGGVLPRAQTGCPSQ